MNKQETIPDIIAKKRLRASEMEKTLGDQHSFVELLRDDADRLEAAWKRESATAENSSAVGDAAKLREVVDLLARVILPPQEEYPAEYGGGKVPDKDGWLAWIRQAQSYAKSALAAPPRNCDVGSAVEQNKRFVEYCKGHRIKIIGHVDVCDSECPCRKGGDLNLCALRWAQMPYEDGEKGEVDDSKEILPPCNCGGEAATVERGTEPEGFAVMCSRCLRKTALHPSLALAEDEWRTMFPHKPTKGNNK